MCCRFYCKWDGLVFILTMNVWKHLLSLFLQFCWLLDAIIILEPCRRRLPCLSYKNCSIYGLFIHHVSLCYCVRLSVFSPSRVVLFVSTGNFLQISQNIIAFRNNMTAKISTGKSFTGLGILFDNFGHKKHKWHENLSQMSSFSRGT